MKYFKITIFSLLFLFSACNTEEGLIPAEQASYIKIIPGKGSDAPLSVQNFNGDLLIISNSRSVERNVTNNRVRILRVDLRGNVLKEVEYPDNPNQNWNAKDVLLIGNDKIVVGGTVGTDSSLFFLELNAQLDSIRTQYYSSGLDQYQLTGLSYDEPTSKIYFGGSEWNDTEEYTLFGQINATDLSIEQTFRNDKAKALPATPILQDASGGLIWAYNSDKSVLVRSTNREMKQLDDNQSVDLDSFALVVSKKLIRNSAGEIILFGETKEAIPGDPTQLFLYSASTSKGVVFGGAGENQFNGAKEIENGYLIVGSTEISEVGSSEQLDFFLARISSSGKQLLFSKSFGSDADEELHDAVMINQEIYSIGSTTIGINNTLLLIKTDKFGKLVN